MAGIGERWYFLTFLSHLPLTFLTLCLTFLTRPPIFCSCGPSASDKPCAGTINDGDWTFQFEAAEISPKGCIAVGAVGGPPADTPVYECQALKNSGDTCDGTRATPAAAGGDTYTSGKADVWTFTYDGQCVMGACDDTTSECTVRYNTPCTTDIECGDFFNCFAETDTCLKKCALWNRLRDNGYGTGLIQEQCADGDFCDRESCRPRAAIGEACSPSVDNNCVQGAYCFGAIFSLVIFSCKWEKNLQCAPDVCESSIENCGLLSRAHLHGWEG